MWIMIFVVLNKQFIIKFNCLRHKSVAFLTLMYTIWNLLYKLTFNLDAVKKSLYHFTREMLEPMTKCLLAHPLNRPFLLTQRAAVVLLHP